MSLYHFNLADGSREQDIEGIELPSIEAAQIEAITFAGDMARERAAAIWADGSLQVEVTDHDGLMLLLVTMIVTNAPATGSQPTLL